MLLVLFFSYYWTISSISSYNLYSRAYESIEKRNYEKGEKILNEALELKEDISWINEIAKLYVKQSRFYDAEDKYRLALSIDPDDYETRFNYGSMFFLQRNYEKANLYLDNLLKEHPKDIKLLERIGEIHIEWGKEDKEKWDKANEVYYKLLEENYDKEKFYLSKRLEVASLQENYELANYFFREINKRDPEYIEEKAFIKYLGFLTDYFQDINSLNKETEIEENKIAEQNNNIFNINKEISNVIYKNNPLYIPLYYEMSRWSLTIKEEKQAKKWIEEGLDLYEQKNEIPNYFSASNLYNFLGKLHYRENEILKSIDNFEESLVIDPSNPIGNYYMGKINLIDLDKRKASENYFEKAYKNWERLLDDRYKDLIYVMGYLKYKQSLDNISDVEEADKKIKEAINFWNELFGNLALKKDYIVDYALGISYYRLGKNDLAHALFANNIENLKPLTEYYSLEEGKVADEVKEKLKILSDLQNNFAIVSFKKDQDRTSSTYINDSITEKKSRQKSIEYLINSINLKNQLGILTGIPYSNFNTITDEINRELVVSDNFLPKTLLQTEQITK